MPSQEAYWGRKASQISVREFEATGAALMITLGQLKQAEKRIVGIAYRTPLVPYLRSDQDMPLLFKTENLQPIGVFKLRGAYNKIASLSEENRRRGVVAFSSETTLRVWPMLQEHLALPRPS